MNPNNLYKKYSSEMLSKVGKQTCEKFILIDKAFPKLKKRSKDDNGLKKFNYLKDKYENILNGEIKKEKNKFNVNFYCHKEKKSKNSLWATNWPRNRLNALDIEKREKYCSNYLDMKKTKNNLVKGIKINKETNKNKNLKSQENNNIYEVKDNYKIKGFSFDKQINRKSMLNISYDKFGKRFEILNIPKNCNLYYKPWGNIKYKNIVKKKKKVNLLNNTINHYNTDFMSKNLKSVILPLPKYNNLNLKKYKNSKNENFYEILNTTKLKGYINFENQIGRETNFSRNSQNTTSNKNISTDKLNTTLIQRKKKYKAKGIKINYKRLIN